MALLADSLDMALEWLPPSCFRQVLSLSGTLRASLDSPPSWRRRCVALWSGKAHISAQSRTLLQQDDAKAAMRASLEESRQSGISQEELCNAEWHCRMKRSAGKEWTRNDPWWCSAPARRVRFSPNGELLRPDGDLWKPAEMDGKVMRWRFAWWVPEWSAERHQPAVRRVDPGTRVKIHDFPSALVWRHPLNWGFVLDSPWSLMTSFAMPPRGAVNSTDRQERELARSLRDSRLRHTVQDAPLEVDVYRSGLTVPDVAPAPEHFFARELGGGEVRFFIRVPDEEQEDNAESLHPDGTAVTGVESEEEHQDGDDGEDGSSDEDEDAEEGEEECEEESEEETASEVSD